MRWFNDLYKSIGEELIHTEAELNDILEFEPRIAYLSCDEEKVKNRRNILGECTKVSSTYDWCCDFDFFITIYEPNIAQLSDEQVRILLFHELKHVGVSVDGDSPSFYIRPHDKEDFDIIIARYGLNWNIPEGE